MRALALLGPALAGQVAVLAALAAEENEANAAFEHAELQHELLSQEAGELEAEGGDPTRVLAAESQDMRTEIDANDRLDEVSAGLRAQDLGLNQTLALVEARELLDEAVALRLREAAAEEKAAGLQAKVKTLSEREASLAQDANALDARRANETAALQPGALDAELHAEVTGAKHAVRQLKAKANADLKALRTREKKAPKRELAALRWQEGSVKEAFARAKGRAKQHSRELEEKLRVFEIEQPLLEGKAERLGAKLRHAQNEASTVQAAEQQASAEYAALEMEVQNLTSTAEALAPGAEADAGPGLHKAQRALEQKRRGLLARRVQVEDSLRKSEREASALRAHRKSDLKAQLRQSRAARARSNPDDPLEAEALDASLETDPGLY